MGRHNFSNNSGHLYSRNFQAEQKFSHQMEKQEVARQKLKAKSDRRKAKEMHIFNYINPYTFTPREDVREFSADNTVLTALSPPVFTGDFSIPRPQYRFSSRNPKYFYSILILLGLVSFTARDNPASVGCSTGLVMGAMSSSMLGNPLPMLPATLNCVSFAAASNFPILKEFITKVKDISNRIEKINIVLGPVLTTYGDRLPPDIDALLHAILNTNSQIQLILNPISTIAGDMALLLAETVIAQFKDFADLMQIYNETNNSWLIKLKIERQIQDYFNKQTNDIVKLKQKYSVDEVQAHINKLQGEKAVNEGKLRTGLNNIAKLHNSIQYFQTLIIKIDNLWRRNYAGDRLTQEDIKLFSEMDNDLEMVELAYDNAKQQIDYQRDVIDKMNQRLPELRKTIAAYDPLLSQARDEIVYRRGVLSKIASQEKVLDAYRSQINSKLKEFSDRIQAKQSYLQMELARRKNS